MVNPYKFPKDNIIGLNESLSAKADSSIIASAFDATATYAVDDYVIYNGLLYKCTTAHTGEWDASDFTATLVSDEFGSGGGGADLSVIAAEFSTSTAYAVGDYVTYEGDLYRCTTAHSAGAWNSSHFTQTTVDDELDNRVKKTGDTMSGKLRIEASLENGGGAQLAASGTASHAEGEKTKATGAYSHAEGDSTQAQGKQSHAEGFNSIAKKQWSHAEGVSTSAEGNGSHAEGNYSKTSHVCSHAEGSYTITGADYQHVEGKYNVGKSTTLWEVGNGTADNARANAAEIDLNGNLTVSGNVTDGDGNSLSDIEDISKSVANAGKMASFKTKTWSGLTNFSGSYVWTDGDDIYYSFTTTQYVLNKSTSTWTVKSWSGLTDFEGQYIWTDGDNIYYSNGSNQYVLDRVNSAWTQKTWSGLTNFDGRFIWTDGDDIYYSYNAQLQYVLNKSTSTWTAKTWTGTIPDGNNIWTDGTNIYYSLTTTQYVLDKSTSTWSVKSWEGLTSFNGQYIWTDGDNIYYSYGTYCYILDKNTSTWYQIKLTGISSSSFYGTSIWTDGDNIYYSSSSYQYQLFFQLINAALGQPNGIATLDASGKVPMSQTYSIIPVDPSTTPTINGSIWIVTS